MGQTFVSPPEEFNVPVENLPYAKELKTRLPYTESMLRTEIARTIGAGSSCWETLEGAGVFESERAVKIAEETTDKIINLVGLGEPHLGCASTRELLKEIETRLACGHRDLDYRTVE